MIINSVSSKSVTASSGGEQSIAQPAPLESNPVATKATAAPVGASTKDLSPDLIAKAVEQINDALIQKGKNLLASIDKDETTGLNVVTVTDKSTLEVITQFPTKSVVAMAEVISHSLDGKGQLVYVQA